MEFACGPLQRENKQKGLQGIEKSVSRCFSDCGFASAMSTFIRPIGSMCPMSQNLGKEISVLITPFSVLTKSFSKFKKNRNGKFNKTNVLNSFPVPSTYGTGLGHFGTVCKSYALGVKPLLGAAVIGGSTLETSGT